MKILYLNDIKKAIDVPVNDINPVITNVFNNINKIESNSVIFHLNREATLDVDKLKKLDNVFIVTDQLPLKEWGLLDEVFILVKNVNRSYQMFVDYYRNLFSLPIIAVTGTNGKSTTKEMIAQVLRNKYKVVANIGSRNNPAFNLDHLLEIDDQTDYAVFETCIINPGYVSNTLEYYKPSVGIITNVGIDHLSGCKTPDNYLRAKSEMIAGLNYQGTLIINGDDENIKRLDLSYYKGKIIRFGLNNDNDFVGLDIEYTIKGMRFKLIVSNISYDVEVPGIGEHNVYNALACLACVNILGVSMEEAIRFLSNYKHIKSHLEVHKGLNDSMLIDDTWHINIKGVEAALKVLDKISNDKKKVVVFGRIPYLKEDTDYYYHQIGELLIEHKIDYLVTIDSQIKLLNKRMSELGFSKAHLFHCKNKNEIEYVLNLLSTAKTIILLKESMYDKTLKELLPRLIKD